MLSRFTARRRRLVGLFWSLAAAAVFAVGIAAGAAARLFLSAVLQ